MLATDQGQRARMIDYIEGHAPARSRDLASIGVSGTTIARAVADGVVVRIGRGLYQLPGSESDLHAGLIEIAKLAPKAVICLTSALSFHQLTDQLPTPGVDRHRRQGLGTEDRIPSHPNRAFP